MEAPFEQFEQPAQGSVDLWLQLPSWLTSMVVHLGLVVLLALVTIVSGDMGDQLAELLVAVDPGTSGDQLENSLAQPPSALDDTPADAVELSVAEMVEPLAMQAPSETIELVPPAALGIEEFVLPWGEDGDLDARSLSVRSDISMRDALLRTYGGTQESEDAVQMALDWLAAHQFDNGSWTFSHHESPQCHGECRNPGKKPGSIAATALALLPFLGNGQTHREGRFQSTVERGLRFLVGSMKFDGTRGSLFEPAGQMYGHGLASIVLCEAYGMTRDESLREAAQGSIYFIAQAQDPRGGGWRYEPGQKGDTSVVGWQLMALKSAQMAYLTVPQSTLLKVNRFLNHVQSRGGANYGYQGRETGRPATSAIGLLCRMYQGWSHDKPALVDGIGFLEQLGPSIDSSADRNNMYYNYYATQVMRHYGGSPWRRWNEVMREYLIQTQSTSGHETGSWYFDGNDHGSPAGGRLYCTAMSAMTLEVYYRHMPLYRPQSVQVMPGQ